MMNTDKYKIDRIVDSLDRLTDIAETKQNIADKVVHQISIAAVNLENKAKSLDGIIQREAKIAIQKEIENSLIDKSLSEFKEKADDLKKTANNNYKKTKETSEKIQKTIWIAIVVIVLFHLGFMVVNHWFINSENQVLKRENQQLRSENIKLKKNADTKRK